MRLLSEQWITLSLSFSLRDSDRNVAWSAVLSNVAASSYWNINESLSRNMLYICLWVNSLQEDEKINGLLLSNQLVISVITSFTR